MMEPINNDTNQANQSSQPFQHNHSQQPHQTYQTAEPPREPRRRSIIGPVILVLLGVGFLLQNLGLLDFNIWSMAWRLWPVWLIAAGLDMIIGRRSSWGSWVAIGLIVTIIAGGITFGRFVGNGFTVGDWGSWGSRETITINEPLQGAKSADIRIGSGVGELRVTADDAGDELVEGVVEQWEGERIVTDSRMSGDRAIFSIKSESQGIRTFWNGEADDRDWDLKLNPTVPTDLNISTGVGEAVVDLSEMNLTRLTVSTGVGETELTVPAQGTLSAKINTGIGKTTIYVPKGMGFKVRADQGIGTIRIEGVDDRPGAGFVSTDYESAQNKIDLDIDGGIGEIRVIPR